MNFKIRDERMRLKVTRSFRMILRASVEWINALTRTAIQIILDLLIINWNCRISLMMAQWWCRNASNLWQISELEYITERTKVGLLCLHHSYLVEWCVARKVVEECSGFICITAPARYWRTWGEPRITAYRIADIYCMFQGRYWRWADHRAVSRLIDEPADSLCHSSCRVRFLTELQAIRSKRVTHFIVRCTGRVENDRYFLYS